MYYNSSNPVDLKRAQTRFESLIKNGKSFELTEKQLRRTDSQNKYLHLLLTWFSIESGNDIDFVKENYFKRLCNKDIFLVSKTDPYVGEIETLRSSSDIDTAQMTTAIERFRNWSATNGIYLPEPNEDEFLKHITIEAERYKQFI